MKADKIINMKPGQTFIVKMPEGFRIGITTTHNIDTGEVECAFVNIDALNNGSKQACVYPVKDGWRGFDYETGVQLAEENKKENGPAVS